MYTASLFANPAILRGVPMVQDGDEANAPGGVPVAETCVVSPWGNGLAHASNHWFVWSEMGVSENSGTPKWMVYNGKPY